MIITDTNNIEYITPSNLVDLSLLNTSDASALIINGEFKGNLSKFPKLRKLIITDKAVQRGGALLSHINSLLVEIINHSMAPVNFGIDDHFINLQNIYTTKWDDTIVNAPNLSYLTIEDDGIIIGGFSNKAFLKKVVLNSPIGASAFENCSSLQEVVLYNGSTKIGEYAFKNCPIKTVIINNPNAEVSETAFDGCSIITDILAPWSAITPSGSYETVVITSGTNINDNLSNNNNLKTLIFNNKEESVNITDNAFENCQNLKKVVLHNNIRSIGNSAFKQCYNLQNIILPASIQGLGEQAFSDCISLEEITIPLSITNIGAQTFYNCQNLKKIILHNNIKSIGNSAFKQCYNLQSITFPALTQTIGEQAFSDCINLEEVVFIAPNSRTDTIEIQVKDTSFDNCNNIHKLSIPIYKNIKTLIQTTFNNQYIAHLTLTGQGTIPDALCSGWPKLNTVVFGDQVKTIGSDTDMVGAFSYCPKLHTVVFGTGVRIIGAMCFQKSAIKTLTIPDNVSVIRKHVFNGCSELEQVKMSRGLYFLGDNAFIDCVRLKTVSGPVLSAGHPNSGDTTFGKHVFQNCKSLNKIIIGDTAPKISDYAFASCVNLKEITVGKNVTEISRVAFTDCKINKVINRSSLNITAGSNAYGGIARYATVITES